MNKVLLIGRLGRDPHTVDVGGTKKVSFDVGTSIFRKDRDGNTVESTDWNTVVAWGKLGERCAEYLRKGSQVGVTGRLRTRLVEKSEGQRTKYVEVEAEEVEFLSKAQTSSAQERPHDGGERGHAASPGPGYNPDLPQDDIPF